MRALKKTVIFGVIIALAASVSGCNLFPKEEEILPPPLTEPPQAEYETYTVTREYIARRVGGIATFRSTSNYDLSFKSGGTLKAIHVSLNDTVKKGQLLMELENESLERSLKRMELDLQNQQLDFENTKKNLESQIEQEKQKLEELKKEYEYKSAPEMQGIVSQKELDDLQKKIKDQEAAIVKAQENYQYQITKLSNNLKKAQMEYEYSKQDYEKTKLVSPIDGIVSTINTNLRIGANVPANQMVIQIQDPNTLYLSYTDDQNAQYFQLNAEVEVQFNNQTYKGIVVQTPTTLAAGSGGNPALLNTVFIKVDELVGKVRANDRANVYLTLAEKENAVVIPRAYLQQVQGRNFVWVLDEEAMVKRERDVEIGINDGTRIEIVKGLEAGEKIVAR